MKKLLPIFCVLIVATLCNAQPSSGSGPQGGSAWGGINGTLSAQTDLQTALNLKAPLASPTFTGTVILPSGQALIAPALGTIASGDGAALTSLNATAITSGTVAAARIDSTIATDAEVAAAYEPILPYVNSHFVGSTSLQGLTLTNTSMGGMNWNISAGGSANGVSGGLYFSTNGIALATLTTNGLFTAASFAGAGTLLTAINGENIQDDTIDEDSIDFGTGTDQVSAVDIPITDSGGILAATDVEAALQEVGKVVTKVHSAGGSYTVGTTSTAEVYRGRIIVAAAGTVQLPPVFPGMEFMVTVVGNIAVSVDSNASDLIVLNGIALDDGDKITNDSLAGSTVVFTYYNATGWIAVSDGTWTDTGP